jgi:hypothetical protein
MFLLAKLQTDYVFATPDAPQRNRRLSSLPTTPTDPYLYVFQRMSHDQRQFARKILSWVYYVQRILFVTEIQEALDVQIGEEELDYLNISSPESILQTCGGMIDCTQLTFWPAFITFSHALVWKFLEENTETSRLQPSEISLAYLTYLGYMGMADLDCLPHAGGCHFLNYATGNWSVHVGLQAVARDLAVE